MRFVKYGPLVGFEVRVLSTSVWKLQSTSWVSAPKHWRP